MPYFIAMGSRSPSRTCTRYVRTILTVAHLRRRWWVLARCLYWAITGTIVWIAALGVQYPSIIFTGARNTFGFHSRTESIDGVVWESPCGPKRSDAAPAARRRSRADGSATAYVLKTKRKLHQVGTSAARRAIVGVIRSGIFRLSPIDS